KEGGGLGPWCLGGEALERRAVGTADPAFRDAAAEQRPGFRQSVLPPFDAEPPLVEASAGLEAANTEQPPVTRQAERWDAVRDVSAHRAPRRPDAGVDQDEHEVATRRERAHDGALPGRTGTERHFHRTGPRAVSRIDRKKMRNHAASGIGKSTGAHE